MRRHVPLLLIVVAYLLMGTLFATLTPVWQAPDEPAHYNYVRQLAAGQIPVIEPGDYDQDYLFEVVFVSAFAPQYDVTSIEYEDWQPPLYYLLQTPVYAATGGSVLAMRLLSVLLGAGVVVLAYATVLRLTPELPWLALTTAVFVAFLPQHMAILASINNDALAELIIAALLWVLVGLADTSRPTRTGDWLLLGVLLGLGYLAKGTVYPLTAVAALVLIWRCWGAWGDLLRFGLRVGLPALLLGGLWWVRNMVVYGGLDVLGKAAHDAVVVGQPRTAAWVADFGVVGTLQRFVQTTFNSFWGQFGWMTLPMTHPGWLYPLLWAFTAVALLGLLISLLTRRAPRISLLQGFVLLGTVALALGVHVVYNLTFVQHQGRYLFPALIPLAFGVAVGLDAWIRPFAANRPRLAYLVPVGLAVALLALDLYALFRVILPAFA